MAAADVFAPAEPVIVTLVLAVTAVVVIVKYGE